MPGSKSVRQYHGVVKIWGVYLEDHRRTWTRGSFAHTLRIIGPPKLAILRSLPLLYRFNPFHWRVQDP